MKIRFNDRQTTIPQAWNDLPLEKLYIVSQTLLLDIRQLLPYEVRHYQKTLLLREFLSLSVDDLTDWEQAHQEKLGEEDGTILFLTEMDALCQAFDFLYELVDEKDIETPPTYQLSFTLTKCPYPILSDTSENFYAPADALDNITLYELATTFSHFEEYIRTKEEIHIDNLLATLYRPSKPESEHNKRSGYEGDRRLPLLKHESTVAQRVERMRLLPRPTKQLILFWFASCRQQIIRAYPNIFTQSEGEEQGGNDYGWSGVLMNLSDGLVHLDSISQQNYSNALVYLSWLEDQRKLEKLRNIAGR